MEKDIVMWEYPTNVRPNVSNPALLKGNKVEAKDGSIGHVDEATEEVNSSAIVVDTGPWIFGRKVVIPAGAVLRVDPDEEKVYLSMTKDAIKNSPEFDPELGWRNDEYRTRLGSYYRDRWAS